MAVGADDGSSGLSGSFAERWDGSAWTVAPVPDPGPGADAVSGLAGVSCTAADACAAVGSYGEPTVTQVERWDGSGWSLQPTPNPSGAIASNLEAVACTGAGACTAVGLAQYSGFHENTLTEAWDGSAWTIVPSPSPGLYQNETRGLSCPAANACTAVGDERDSADADPVTMALAWDGTSWSVQSTPVLVGGRSSLQGVSCVSAAWCQAVGGYQNDSGLDGEQPVAMVFRGGRETVLGASSSAGGVIGSSVDDMATLSKGVSPTGQITFKLYGPGDSSCSELPALTRTVAASGDGSYPSGSFTPTVAGSYMWTVEYSGDQTNDPSDVGCGAAGQRVVITRATPTLSARASSNVSLGGQVSDSATLSGGHAPTGRITFRLYGPADSSCAQPPAFTRVASVSGDGSYSSGSIIPTRAGAYLFTADYSGDHNNHPELVACGTAGQRVVVSSTG
jgi:hypothetical protein